MSRSGTRQSSILSRRSGPPQRVVYLAKKLLIALALILVFAGVIWGLVANGFFARTANSAQTAFVNTSAAHGFIVKNLMVEGRTNLSRDGLKSLINIDKNAPLFAQDLRDIQMKIQGLTWVKTAIVSRRFPDTLYIKITEREPVALWQRNGTLAVVDDEAVVLTDLNIQKFKNLLVVVGEEAPQNTRALLAILNKVPSIQQRVDAAKWIGKRRWDLTLNNKIVLRLPAENPMESLEKLAALHANDAVLDRPITSIDLRDKGRIIVQTAPGDAHKIDANSKAATTANDKEI